MRTAAAMERTAADTATGVRQERATARSPSNADMTRHSRSSGASNVSFDMAASSLRGASHRRVPCLALEAFIGVGTERSGDRGAFHGAVGNEGGGHLAEDVHADCSNWRASRARARWSLTFAAETEIPMASAISAWDQS